ncbi:MAG: non-canonical purine NTP pyrophosphatase, RdgB/HAM1 family [Acidocella sp. 20-57-95]|nr:MAG: non-canonical purine NTP pyrophosphatase, RdgB/HAM1 family [Acidocella sp. 20-57-95]OYV62161.1 MAG: non-canonical purine NTP pyrophosphatase, RdgB/HAM1 family [Acidocella sp. 21-58-7]HQT65316.1 RdgB/HAM1 family non-canonical purine NTP pyrophosphatase [Acidocella sp.]
MRRILVATHNKGKLAEFAALLGPVGYEVVSAGELGLAEPEETGASFAENARIKARAAAMASGLPALADDSGLCVAALDGAPGIYSARFAAGDYPAAFAKVIAACEARDEWRARFVCALCYAQPAGDVATYIGQADGVIAKTPEGLGGFGYDPIFIPDGYAQSYAVLGADVKDKVSHRARAFAQLVSVLRG